MKCSFGLLVGHGTTIIHKNNHLTRVNGIWQIKINKLQTKKILLGYKTALNWQENTETSYP